MRFNFRLEKILRQRRVEQDLAQREYLIAQNEVQDQLAHIKGLYAALDAARLKSEEIQLCGGECTSKLMQIEEYMLGQKVKIQNERQRARELMQIAEEKHEILIEKAQSYKAIEKLKENKKEEFKKEKNKKEIKEMNDLVAMRFVPKN